MPVSAIGATPSTTGNAANLQASGIGQEDFLRILLTQLQFQDPLKPLDNQQFIAQLAQFTTLEQTRQLNDGIDTLLSIQSATQSIGLVGRNVEIVTSSGTSVGTVTTITINQGEPELTIQLANGAFLTGVNPTQVSVIR